MLALTYITSDVMFPLVLKFITLVYRTEILLEFVLMAVAFDEIAAEFVLTTTLFAEIAAEFVLMFILALAIA